MPIAIQGDIYKYLMSYLFHCHSFSIDDGLVAMPMKLWSMKYIILGREKFFHYVEVRILKSKSIKEVCPFILEDIICCYKIIERMKVDLGELDMIEAYDFFTSYGMQLKLTIFYNPKPMVRVKRVIFYSFKLRSRYIRIKPDCFQNLN